MAEKDYTPMTPPPELFDFWYRICLAEPDKIGCTVAQSLYGYRIQLLPNFVLLGLFIASFVGFIVVHLATRKPENRNYGFGFTVAMCLGCLSETLGYGARIWSYKNQWHSVPWVAQVCCLNAGSVFIAAALYLCMRRMTDIFGPQQTRIPPVCYTRIFIPLDFVSILVQSTGVAMRSASIRYNEPTDADDKIMLVGVVLQAFTMLCFVLVSLNFFSHLQEQYDDARANNSSSNNHGNPETDLMARRHASKRFRFFLVGMGLAALCMFERCVYRVIELGPGWDGPLMARQGLVIGCEQAVVAAACLLLNVWHPSLHFREMLEGQSLRDRIRRARIVGPPPAPAPAPGLFPGEERLPSYEEAARGGGGGGGSYVLEARARAGLHAPGVPLGGPSFNVSRVR